MSAAKQLSKRVTVYLEPKLHRAVKLKAVETNVSVSDVVNEAVEGLQHQDADDLNAFDSRRNESSASFSDFAKQLKRFGKL